MLVTGRTTFSGQLKALMRPHGGPSWWGRELGVHRTTVDGWWSGTHLPRNERVLDRISQKVGARLAWVPEHEHEEAAPPEWARRLADESVGRIIEGLSTTYQVRHVDELIGRLEQLLLPDDEAPLDRRRGRDRGAGRRPS